MDILVITNISRPNNFVSLTKDEWKWLITEIKKDFGDKLTLNNLAEIVTKGVKGEYDKNQFVVNGLTIYRWIKTWLVNRPKVKLPCPDGIEGFYWVQMSEKDQLAYLDKQKLEKN